MERVAILGATGTIGQAIARKLSNRQTSVLLFEERGELRQLSDELSNRSSSSIPSLPLVSKPISFAKQNRMVVHWHRELHRLGSSQAGSSHVG